MVIIIFVVPYIGFSRNFYAMDMGNRRFSFFYLFSKDGVIASVFQSLLIAPICLFYFVMNAKREVLDQFMNLVQSASLRDTKQAKAPCFTPPEALKRPGIGLIVPC